MEKSERRVYESSTTSRAHKFKCISSPFPLWISFSRFNVQKTLPFGVSLRSVRISFPLLWIFKLLFNSSAPALFFLRFFYFVYMSLTTSSLSPFMAIYCRSDRFGEARSWLFAISFLLLFFFVRWLTYLALASCKINAIYYILPKTQVQVCVYAFTIPLELTVRERWIIGGNIN